MFGQNTIVGQKYFDEATIRGNDRSNELLVTSMFMTLQGEGPFAGCPAFFVRLSKCNLACSFCDTYFDSGNWFTLDALEKQINQRIRTYFNGVVPHWADHWPGKRRGMVLVITGGEPMLQRNLSAFCELMLTDTGFDDVQIESNGIIVQDDLPENVFLVVSPKCAEKNGVATKYLEPHEKMLARADCLKFVMNAEPDSPYSSIPRWAHEWAYRTEKQIFVSPMNVYNRQPITVGPTGTLDHRSKVDEVVSFWEPGLLNMEKNQANHEFAAHYCITHGLRLSIQMHLYASVA
jgi:7-carboxy-7-deazaguanine synthase